MLDKSTKSDDKTSRISTFGARFTGKTFRERESISITFVKILHHIRFDAASTASPTFEDNLIADFAKTETNHRGFELVELVKRLIILVFISHSQIIVLGRPVLLKLLRTL